MINLKSHKKIVLIEDHDSLRLAMTQFLEAHSYSVTALECAEDYNDSASAQGADIFIVDLTLPGEDGLAFVRRIRAASPFAFIVIATARVDIEDRVSGYTAGANIYLQKPIDHNELIAIISAKVNALHPSGSAAKLNINDQSITYRGRTAQLSSAETTILHRFSAAGGMVLEAWQIIALYCDDDETFNAQNLQMRISRLRRKLEGIGMDKSAIRSERGVGYHLTCHIQSI